MSVYDDAGAQWDVDPDLLRALEMQESGGKTTATSPTGAEGNMQFEPPTARGVGVANTRVPAFSVFGAAKLLHDLRDGPAKGDITTALRMYHGGPDPSKWGPVNAAYAPTVFANLQKMKGQAPPPGAGLAFNPARMSDADLTAQLDRDVAAAGSAPGALSNAPATGTAPSIAGMTDAQLQAQLDADVAASNAPVAGTPAAAQPQPGETTTHAVLRGFATPGSPTSPLFSPEESAAMLAGEQAGLRNIGITANRLIGDPLGMLPGQTAAREAYNAKYANSGPAQLGSLLSSTAATLPIMGAVNPLVARGVGAGVNALGSVAPGLASAAQGGVDLLSGALGAPTATAAGSVPLQVLSRGAVGAVQGGEAAAINSGASDNPLATQVAHGALVGGSLGAAAPALGAAGSALTGRGVQLSPEVAQIAQMARDNYGIQLTAPQLGLSPSLAYASSALKMVPLSGAGAENAATQQQFNRAVSQTFGENATKITPDILTGAQRRIGGVMSTIENGANVSLDNTFLNDAARIEANARTSLPDSEYGVVKRQFDNIMKNLQPGDTISGTTYGNLIHKGSPLDSALNSSDSNIKNFAGQIRDALRDSLTRSLAPEDASAYQLARTQYKNLMTVRPLTLRADATGGAAPSTGDISPAALRSAVNRSYGDSVAMEPPGSVPLNDLARIGQMLKEPPSSGTAERGSMLALGAKAAELGGALAAGHYAGVLPAAATLGAGVAGGRLAGAYLRSPGLANRMIDTSLNPLAYRAPNPLLLRYAAPLAVLANPATTREQRR
jgi:hypothetical protein